MDKIFARIIEGNEIEPYDYSILLIGECGRGKSTLVKAIIASVFEANADNFLEIVKNTNCRSMDDYYEVDQNIENYCNSNNTQFVKVSGAITNFKTVLFVNTPGIDFYTELSEGNKKLLQIIQAAQFVKRFNAIFILKCESDNRWKCKKKYIRYLLKAIPSNFENSILIIQTFSTDKRLDFFHSYFNVTIQNSFFFNNYEYNYKREYISSNPMKKKKINKKLKKSTEMIKKMFDYVFKMEAKLTSQYNELFNLYSTYYSKISDYKHLLKCILKIKKYLKENFNIEVASKVKLEEYVIINKTEYSHNLNKSCKTDTKFIYISEKCFNKIMNFRNESIQEILKLFYIPMNMREKEKIDMLLNIKIEQIILDLYQQQLLISEINPNF